MKNCIGIRKESKDQTETRAALTPEHVRQLVQMGITVLVEPSQQRIFSEEAYRQSGAQITEDLQTSNLILGIKEIPEENLTTDQAYCFFSHTIKGQSYNMPMLKKMLALNNTLMDYEMVKDPNGKRTIFFGNFAGYAGMLDSLWALGQRLQSEGLETPFKHLLPAHRYSDLEAAQQALQEAGQHIVRDGLPASLVPFICGFSGYGQVSKGAQQIYDLLPVVSIAPQELANFAARGQFSNKALYKVEFHEKDMVVPKPVAGTTKSFDLQEYYNYPERYQGVFEAYLPYLTMLINGIYWEPRFPRLVTKPYLRSLYQQALSPRLRVIGDISCDINGSVEMTVKATNSQNPVYVFDPSNEQVTDGWEGNGPVIMAVDKLPAELPKEASQAFGDALMPYIAELAGADFQLSFEQLPLSSALKDATIVHHGQLTEIYQYLQQYLR